MGHKNKARQPATILLADDHEMVRAGLRSILEKEPWMRVVGEADNGHTAVQLAEELKPAVVLMDITMPDLNGIEATRAIMSRDRGIKVIALSMHTDRPFVTEILKAGASGYLLKNSAARELTLAIEAVLNGNVYLDPQAAQVVVNDVMTRARSARETVFGVLTAREREVLQLLAEGMTNRQVAKRLHISAKTVESHRAQIMEKLDIHNVAALTKYAVREGLTPLED